ADGDDVARTALPWRHQRLADRHSLDQHPAERLAPDRRVDRHVHGVEAGGHVVARPGEDDASGQIRAGDARTYLRRILRAEAVHAPDHQAVEVGAARQRLRDRLGDHLLPLPVLQVPDDPDQRRALRDAELPPDGRTSAGPELVAVDTVEHGDEAVRADARGAVVLDQL